ncbi:MAG TPA: hypothetical protein DCR74_03720 [Achromobacter sp.]|nr:hypothetical protein [Achromobacter sp.]
MSLNLHRRSKKQLPERPRQTLGLTTEPNSWSLDFMRDALQCSLRLRTSNAIDGDLLPVVSTKSM